MLETSVILGEILFLIGFPSQSYLIFILSEFSRNRYAWSSYFVVDILSFFFSFFFFWKKKREDNWKETENLLLTYQRPNVIASFVFQEKLGE